MSIWTKIGEAIKAWIIKRSQPKPSPDPSPFPTPVPTPAPIPVTGDLEDPAGYTEENVAANAHYEECHIEPATGLMVRYSVYRPSCRNWWMLSSLGEGHVRIEGPKNNGTLIAENFTKNGQTIEVLGFADYEMHKGDTPENIRYISRGNSTPYDGSRRYVIVVCHKSAKTGVITIFGGIVIAVSAAILAALARRIAQ